MFIFYYSRKYQRTAPYKYYYCSIILDSYVILLGIFFDLTYIEQLAWIYCYNKEHI